MVVLVLTLKLRCPLESGFLVLAPGRPPPTGGCWLPRTTVQVTVKTVSVLSTIEVLPEPPKSGLVWISGRKGT
jgi:hypothetical protein